MKTAAKYIAFAGIASACNLLLQYCTLAVYVGPFALYLAMVIGTGAGLLVKFFLDKFFIFYHTSQKPSDISVTFILYSLTGVGTTALFWGFEVGSDWLFHVPQAKYAGAIIGLSLGYWIKYHMDKRIVFIHKKSNNDLISSETDPVREL